MLLARNQTDGAATSTYFSSGLQGDAGEARASLINRAEKVAEQGTVLYVQLVEIVIVDIRGPECVGHVFAGVLDVLDDCFLGVEEVQGDELDSGISLANLEWFARGDDDPRPDT